MVQFKTNEVKSVGKVQVSAKRLRELAAKLEEIRGTDGNEEIDVYVVPGKDKDGVAQLAFDFSKKEKKAEEQQEEKKPEVKESEPPKNPEAKTEVVEVNKPTTTEETKVEEPPITKKESEETKATVEASKEEPQSEVDRIAKDENLAKKAEEIKEKAYKK